jgi:hypothetical protein
MRGQARIKRAYVVGDVCFVQHPLCRGYWIRTHPCVVKVACAMCGSAIGDACKDSFGKHPTFEPRSNTHYARRRDARRMDFPGGRELRIVIEGIT